MEKRFAAAGALSLLVLVFGLLVFMAGSRPQLSVQVECSPYTTVSPYQGWVEKCHEEVRTITYLNSTRYFTATVCRNIPTTFYETLTFQECHTTTKTFHNVWLQIAGAVFVAVGLGLLLTFIILLILRGFKNDLRDLGSG